MRSFGRVIATELVKLCGLPSVLAAMLGTVAASMALAAAVAASTGWPGAVQVTLQTVGLLQAGPILIGVLSVATEYEGRQIHTTLTAIPRRLPLLAGKCIAYLTVSAVTSATAVGAGLGAGLAVAWATPTVRDGEPSPAVDGRHLVGAVAYLVLIGLLGFALTLLLRSLLAALIPMLTLVLIASPLLARFTEHARWLPDRAGSVLFLPDLAGSVLYLPDADPVLTAGTGALTLLAWIVVTASLGGSVFMAHDA